MVLLVPFVLFVKEIIESRFVDYLVKDLEFYQTINHLDKVFEFGSVRLVHRTSESVKYGHCILIH